MIVKPRCMLDSNCRHHIMTLLDPFSHLRGNDAYQGIVQGLSSIMMDQKLFLERSNKLLIPLFNNVLCEHPFSKICGFLLRSKVFKFS